MNKIHAPWDATQVENLSRYQKSGAFHEFTCANDHDGDRTLEPHTHGWECPSCDYRQNWAWEFMLMFDQAAADQAKRFFGGPTA